MHCDLPRKSPFNTQDSPSRWYSHLILNVRTLGQKVMLPQWGRAWAQIPFCFCHDLLLIFPRQYCDTDPSFQHCAWSLPAITQPQNFWLHETRVLIQSGFHKAIFHLEEYPSGWTSLRLVSPYRVRHSAHIHNSSNNKLSVFLPFPLHI